MLDTLQWLGRDGGIWLEITNLVIPGANNAPEDIERMCRWIAAELGPDVPLHFSAFHPSFHSDRCPADAAGNVAAAYQIARAAACTTSTPAIE